MRRIHLKRQIKCKRIGNLSKKLLIAVMVIMLFAASNYVYRHYISKLLMNYAENKIQELASFLTTNTLNEKLISKIDDDLFIITKDNNKIKSFDFNTLAANKIMIEALSVVKECLKENIEYKVPVGSLFNDALFNNKGPKIKIVFTLSNELSANLNNKITPYGINNAIVETFININLKFKIVIPMSSKKINSTFSIPIAIKIIEGEVPEYYINGYNESSKMITLPF